MISAAILMLSVAVLKTVDIDADGVGVVFGTLSCLRQDVIVDDQICSKGKLRFLLLGESTVAAKM